MLTKDIVRQNDLKPMALCDACLGIQRNWRKAPGHPELVQRGNRKEDRPTGTDTIIRKRQEQPAGRLVGGGALSARPQRGLRPTTNRFTRKN